MLSSCRFALATASVAALFSGAHAGAQTVTDGNSSLLHTAGSTTGATIRTGTGAGTPANLIAGGDSTDQLFQVWWWYRINSGTPSTREFAFSTQTSSTTNGNVLTYGYAEPEGLSATMTYTLTDGADAPASCNVAMDLVLLNTTASMLDCSIFCYVDFDLEGVTGDAAVLQAPGRIEITDQTTGFKGQFLGVSSDAYQVAAFSTIRGLLTDTAVTNLNNSGLPFAAADFTGAQQWNVSLAPGASRTLRAAISLNSTATATNACAADFNGMNGLTPQDIFDFLNAWFMGDLAADFNGGGLAPSDIFDFLNAWFAGC